MMRRDTNFRPCSLDHLDRRDVPSSVGGMAANIVILGHPNPVAPVPVGTDPIRVPFLSIGGTSFSPVTSPLNSGTPNILILGRPQLGNPVVPVGSFSPFDL